MGITRLQGKQSQREGGVATLYGHRDRFFGMPPSPLQVSGPAAGLAVLVASQIDICMPGTRTGLAALSSSIRKTRSSDEYRGKTTRLIDIHFVHGNRGMIG